MTDPQISVVMPVFNAGHFLDAAIDSILRQSFGAFEFVILDDGSTDGSRERIASWRHRDDRIRMVDGERRLGVTGSSNRAVREARCPIVARMDADDVSQPDRLERQLHVLTRSPDVVLVGTLAQGIDARGARVRPRDRWRILRRSPFVPFPHGSAMFRRTAFEAVGGYDDATAGAEDQDLFSRMRRAGRVVTLPDALYLYRYHGQNVTLQNDSPGHRAPVRWRLLTNPHYLRGTMQLWAGGHPRVWRDLWRDRSGPGYRRRSLLLAWAAWAQLSPSTLRWALRSLTYARDGLSGLVVRDGTPYEWRSDSSS
jgi:glycosyltransferase involved in cell wall biosynthesis